VAFFRRLKKPSRLFYGLRALFFLPRPRLFTCPRRRKDQLRAPDQAVDMRIEGRAERVEPV